MRLQRQELGVIEREVGFQTSCSERALDKSWFKQDEEMGMSGLGTVQLLHLLKVLSI